MNPNVIKLRNSLQKNKSRILQTFVFRRLSRHNEKTPNDEKRCIELLVIMELLRKSDS